VGNSLRSLTRAWNSLVSQKNRIFNQEINEPSGWKILCLSAVGEGQGILTGIAFAATIGPAIRGIEAKFGVEIRAIQDNMTIIGDPDIFFGPNGAYRVALVSLEGRPQAKQVQFLVPRNGGWRLDTRPWLRPKAPDMRDPESGDVVVGGLMGLPTKCPWNLGV
jgi:hypothetical protein